MKVLQVNGYQTPGRRFNGIGIRGRLSEFGIHSEHIVWEQDRDENGVSTLDRRWVRWLNRRIRHLEKALALQSVLFQNANLITRMPAFAESDLLHLHIIHSGFLSILDLPRLAKKKPMVWTLHDPWALTGHCIHPSDCDRWRFGCGHCPDLSRPFEMRKDNTRLMFSLKQRAYRRMRVDIIVASRWMRTMVENSPLFDSQSIRVHEIPFGVNLNKFRPGDAVAARKRFDISPGRVVIMFRAEGEFKGVPFLLDALARLDTNMPVTLLSVGRKGVLSELRTKFEVRELGWTNDEAELVFAMQASDVFVMPSTAETFGVMAIEAMACETPVICFEGTALPSIIDAPRVGVSVPMGDSGALAGALRQLVENRTERGDRGRLARALCESRYSEDVYVRKLVDVYQEVVRRARTAAE